MNTEVGLLACPFCGASASVVFINGGHKVACIGHDCSFAFGHFVDARSAAREWNRRAPSPDYADLLARYEAVAFHYGSLSHKLRSEGQPYEWAIEVAERIRGAMQDNGVG